MGQGPAEAHEQGDFVPVIRTEIKPPSLADNPGFVYGLHTTGGVMVPIHGVVPLGNVGPRYSMADHMDIALDRMITDMKARGAKPHDIVSMTMITPDAVRYGEERKSIGGVWRFHLGKKYFPMKMVELAPGRNDEGVRAPHGHVELSGVALVEGRAEESMGPMAWLAGQNGVDLDRELKGDVFHQIEHTLRGLNLVLAEAGASFETASDLRLRMFALPHLIAQHGADIHTFVAERIGQDHIQNFSLSPATGFYEGAALMEIDGYAAL